MVYFLAMIIGIAFLVHRARQAARVESARASRFLTGLEPNHDAVLVPFDPPTRRRNGMSMIAYAYLHGMPANLPRWLVRLSARCYTRDLLRRLP